VARELIIGPLFFHLVFVRDWRVLIFKFDF